MRPIDADDLLEIIEKYCGDYDCHDSESFDKQAVRMAIRSAPTLTPPNEPLTIEQLRDMDGEPVWVALTDEKWSRLNGWYLVHHGNAYLARTDDWELDAEGYGVEWIAYRRPPERQEDT